MRPTILVIAAVLLVAPGCRRAPSESSADTTARRGPAPSSIDDEAPTSRPADESSRPADRLPPTPPSDPRVLEARELRGPIPARWSWLPPEHRMRLANYVVPASSGMNQAHLIVYEIGGGPDVNVERWENQFRSSEGDPMAAMRREMTVADMPVTIVELTGERRRMGSQWFTPGQSLLAAIVDAPSGEIQIVLSGQRETVEANREAFMRLIQGLRPVDDASGESNGG